MGAKKKHDPKRKAPTTHPEPIKKGGVTVIGRRSRRLSCNVTPAEHNAIKAISAMTGQSEDDVISRLLRLGLREALREAGVLAHYMKDVGKGK